MLTEDIPKGVRNTANVVTNRTDFLTAPVSIIYHGILGRSFQFQRITS